MVSAVCVFQLTYFLRLASLRRVIAYTSKFVKQKKKIDSYLPSKCGFLLFAIIFSLSLVFQRILILY